MWESDQLGIAVLQTENATWALDARGGAHGIRVVDSSSSFAPLAFTPVDQPELPAVAEQFVRGDALHLTYPQGEGLYELRIVFRPIRWKGGFVLESTIAIQTDRLDSHPTLDVVVDGDSLATDRVNSNASGASPISVVGSNDRSTCVLLGPHDRPFTTDHSTKNQLRLRLFGDFLEKGVIRKARPWIVFSAEASPSESELRELWRRLCDSPLPLTA